MSGPVKRNATYDDLVELPENVVGEIIGGELYATPRPRLRHALTHGALQALLHREFHQGAGGPGGWWIVPEPELHLGPDTVVPDLAAWRVSRLAEIPDVPFMTLAPDWLCEIASPSTARLDRAKKLPVYAAARVGHVWIVDPAARTLEVLALDPAHGQWRLAGAFSDADVVRAEPFADTPLAIAPLWS